MSPWWLRPTAEGAPEEDSSGKKKAEPPSIPAATPLPYSREPETSAAEDAFPASMTSSFYDDPAPEMAVPPELRAQARDAAAAPAPSYPSAAPGPWPMPYESEPEEEENGNGDAGYAHEAHDLGEPDLGDLPDMEAVAEPGEEPGSERDESAGEKRRRSRRGRGGRRRRGAGAEAKGDEEPEEEAAEEETRELTLPPPVPMAEAREARRRETVRAGESFSLSDFEPSGHAQPREIIVTVPERPRSADERKIALFCDLENIALGVRDSDVAKFDILLVLERLLEKGKIIVKKAYADWERYSEYKRPFHEAAIELIDIPQKYYSGKNSADIKMVVDAMDLSYSKEHLDTFVLLSGDSDFSPLVSKLKENNKYVIGIGVKNSSSNLLVDNCDEFIYYEDVWRDAGKGPQLSGLTKKQSEVFGLMAESIQALVRENKDVLWGSMIKQTMQRKKPSFNEGYYGYSTFSELLEDAAGKNILKLKKDQRSGTYIVTGFAKR